MLVNSDFYTDQKLKIIEAVVADFKTNIEVLHNRGYELKTLFKNVFAIYVRNEGMKFEFAIDQLKDYYNMARIVKKHAEKYPKYLRSTHDIVEANFEVYEEERKRQEEIEQAEAIAKYDEDKRVELEKKMASMQKEWKAKKRDFLKYNGNANFIVTVPETPMELVQEGTDLSHCVASYVDDVKLGRTYIFFLRNKDKPFEASVTLEYKSGVLTTARGDYNRDITWAERDFLQSYCELKKIEFSKIIPDPKGDRPDVTVKKLTEWDNKKTDEWFLKVIKKKAKEDAKTDAEKAIKYREDNNE